MHRAQPALTNPSTWDRRTFLKASALLANWPFLNLHAGEAPQRKVRFKKYPFQLGIASGDPAPDGIVLWTRLAPNPLTGGGMPPEDVPVKWVVANDEAMQKVVQKGTAVAFADWAHSVHVEVAGLQPDRVYWYQFYAGGEASPIGRTRTAPAPDATLDKFSFAVASCQHYEKGLYTAYEHMINEEINLVIHLGDYIYEAGAQTGRVRKHVGRVLKTLDDYRNRHAQYKTDPHLQAVHASVPWVVTWDDHEVRNNYANDISSKPNADPIRFLKRRAAAYKAYYEHMPLRRSSLPRGPAMELYRSIQFGQLIEFSVLDTRQYRTDQPCGDGLQPPCQEVFDPKATLLGNNQEQWLFNNLKKSQAQWNVLAQQVLMARIDRMPGEGVANPMDSWSGYDVARNRLLKFIADHKVSNPIVLTGDIHKNCVNELKTNFDAPEGRTVATEFVATSISSNGDGSQDLPDKESVLSENPFVKFYNGERGYVRCEVNKDRWRSDFQVVEYITKPGAPLITRASFEKLSNDADVHQV